MKKIYYLIPIIIVFGFIGFFYGKKNKPNAELHPKIGPIVESIYGLGTVQSDNVYTLKLGVTTMVKKLFVKEGEYVKKGQRLIQFDEEGLRSQFAPFAGSVTQINYFAGETVFPQAPILTLMDLKNRYVSVAIDQEGALRVRPKQKAVLSFESMESTPIVGSVRTIFPRQGQLVAHIEATQLPAEILPGMTADVAIVVGEKKSATLVPIKAIRQNTIRLKKEGGLTVTSVKLGIVDAEWAEILNPPLNESDVIEMPSE
jgi:multidrug efflux pump subunit AcrA (membrane-fusion protein)